MEEYGVSRDVVRYSFQDQSFWDFPKHFDILDKASVSYARWNILSDYTLNTMIWDNVNFFEDSNKEFINKHIPKGIITKNQDDLFSRY